MALWSGRLWILSKYVVDGIIVKASLNKTLHFSNAVQSLLNKFLINAIDSTMLQEGTNITRIPPITFEACRKLEMRWRNASRRFEVVERVMVACVHWHAIFVRWWHSREGLTKGIIHGSPSRALAT
jgi:hypothetical protein